MKVSTNWIKDYLAFDLPAMSELVERIGAQLGAVEEVIDVGAKFAGAVVVKVVECSKLENSDHLNLCFIDDGGVTTTVERRDDGLVQVVCGAPNVTAGALVVWLPPGATVPSTYGNDPFVLEARALRGTVSNGMLASPKELAIGDSHEGLLLLDGDVTPGTPFADAYQLNDHIIDIENKMFTHRPDCFGQLGVAREVAGILGESFASPEWYTSPATVASGEGLALSLRNDVSQVVPRFMLVALQNVTIAASPLWLQTSLSRVGVRPINNVVDITNYMMLLTGQPLHAYDYDKVAALTAGDGAALVVRYPQADETLQLLSGKTITPRAEAVMIATDQQGIGLGGVMGGANTEVDATTKNIILECATFDMYSIRRTSMAHGLFTDAVTRFNKGQSPLQNSAVLAKAVELLETLAGGQVASPVLDDNHAATAQPTVTVTSDFINARLGLNLSANDMATLLTNVEFAVTVADEMLTVSTPFWRTDIADPEDIVEEVGRLHGFDKLPLTLPKRGITPTAAEPLLQHKAAIRRSLVRAGANELLTYSFVHGKLLDKATQDKSHAYKLSNALSPDLQYYRLSVLPSLLDKVHLNVKAGYDEFALFEIGKGHSQAFVDKTDGLPIEFEDLDFVYASKQAKPGAAFYHARRYLEGLATDLGVTISFEPFSEDPKDPVTDPYDLRRSARVCIDGRPTLGIVGEFKTSVRQGFKLPDYSAGFSVSVKQLPMAHATVYEPLPRFPKVEQDLCLKVPTATNFAELHTVVSETLTTQKPGQTRLTLSTLDIYQRPDDDAHKQITFRVGLASFEKTMTDQEMTTVLERVVTATAERFGAEQV